MTMNPELYTLYETLNALPKKRNEDRIDEMIKFADARLEMAKLEIKYPIQVSHLGVALDVIKRYTDYILKHHRDQAELFLTSLEPFSKEIGNDYKNL